MVNRITTDPQEMEMFIAESIINGTVVEIELKDSDEPHIIFPLSIEDGCIACRVLRPAKYTSNNSLLVRFADIKSMMLFKAATLNLLP